MDRNTFTGLFLILVILVGSTFLLKPSPEEIKKEQQKQHLDSLRRLGGVNRKAPTADASFTPQKTVTADSAALKGKVVAAAPKLVTLENAVLKVILSTQGGRIVSVQLKNEKTFDKQPVILLNPELSKFGLTLNGNNKQVETNDLNFTPSLPELKVSGKDSSTLTMHLDYGANQSIDYVYSLKGDGYKLGYKLVLNNMNGVINTKNNQVTLDWEASLRKQERDMKMERSYSTVYLGDTEGTPSDLSLTKDEQKTFADKKIQWVSFKQRFFSNVLIAKDGFSFPSADVAVSTDINSSDVKQMSAKIQLPYTGGATVSYPMEFYFGPNRFSTLKAQGYHLERQIDLGWGPLKYINRFAVLPVFNFLKNFNWNYGLIILVLTILLKVVLFPLTYKSYLSMAKMRVLKPEMDEIKGKVGDDNPTLLQQEYLKLYKKAGVNPLGGCLPLIIQMPIILAFFRFFPNLFELRGQAFLWMHDLSTYDSVISFPLIPFLNWDHISLMCLLMTISTLIQTYFNNQTSGATGQMKYIGYITPLIFFGVLNSYPAGLNYYYFCANILTFSQQYFIRLMVDDKKIHARIQENKKKPEDPNKKKTGFAAKMEELMRQQRQTPAIQTKKK